MRYKTMKKSGEKISAITVGTWAIGGKNSMGGGYGEIDDQDSIEAIKAMIDGGVNLIDTAPIYNACLRRCFPLRFWPKERSPRRKRC